MELISLKGQAWQRTVAFEQQLCMRTPVPRVHTHAHPPTHPGTHPNTHMHANARTLTQVPEADEVFAAYQLAEASIQQFMHNTHSEWFTLTNEQSLQRELNANLLTVDKSA
eukprot:1159301-Pelagomonas_calceolata.AAC.1